MEPYLYIMLVLLLPLGTHQQTPGGCPPDFLTVLHNCYKMLPDAYKGVEAVSQCQGLGANVTSSKSEAENKLLLDLRSNASRGGQRLWLGMTDSASPNEWRWTDDNSLVDAYPTSHHWRTTWIHMKGHHSKDFYGKRFPIEATKAVHINACCVTKPCSLLRVSTLSSCSSDSCRIIACSHPAKSEASSANNLQCAWITADNKGRVWSHTKCNNHAAITVCKIYLNENPESAAVKTTSVILELSSAQNLVSTHLTTTTVSASSEFASSSNHSSRMTSDVSTASTLLFKDTIKQTSLSVEGEDTSIDETTATMTPSPATTMQPNPSATATTAAVALPSSSAPDLTVETSRSNRGPLGTDTSPVYLLTHTQLFTHISLQTHIETTGSYMSYLPIQLSLTEIPPINTVKHISPNVSPITASGVTSTSQFLDPSTVNNEISHTPSLNCFCPCKTKLIPGAMLSLQKKYSSLILETSTLSSYVRKKISIADFRVSTNYIGASGLLVCLVPLFLVIGSDLLTCVKRK